MRIFGSQASMRRDDDSWFSIDFCGGGCAYAVDVLLSRRTGIVALNPPPVPKRSMKSRTFFIFFLTPAYYKRGLLLQPLLLSCRPAFAERGA